MQSLLTNARKSLLFLLGISFVFLTLHWLYIEADPTARLALISGYNHSADFYTDEGFDSSGAIALSRFGTWYVPGGFNLASIAPLWSAILAVVFHFSGVSISIARSIEVSFYAASVLVFYFFLKLWRPPNDPVPAWSVLVLATNYLAFSFSRLAILESIWTFFVVASLCLGTLACRHASLLLSYLSGLSLACALLTKLTAVSAVVPLAAVFLLYHREKLPRLRIGAAAVGGLLTLLLPYQYVLATWFHTDQIYYMRINLTERAVHTPLEWIHSVSRIVESFRFFDLPLCFAFLLGLFLFRKRLSKPLNEPLVLILSAWLLANLLLASRLSYYPPRYIVHALFPFAALAALFAEGAAGLSKLGGRAVYALLILTAVVGGTEIVLFLVHPRYTVRATAASISSVGSQMHSTGVMGDPAYTLAFYANLLPLNDGFGASPRPARIESSSPGFYLTIGRATHDRELDFAASGRKLRLLRTYNTLGNYLQGEPLYFYKVDRSF
jgi:hypothetical protein